MKIQEKIIAFNQLADKIESLSENEIQYIVERAQKDNGWFSYQNVKNSLDRISSMLLNKKLEEWIERYNFDNVVPKIVGIVMAGNIPLVGFHDLISVLISGHFTAIKPSSDDHFLLKTIIDWIIQIEPRFKKNIEIREKLTEIDAVIATGSDNTSRYFEYYFRHIPRIIRKNRTSIAILTGKESDNELKLLGEDIFSYFGLGCRNVSKIFTPERYEIRNMLSHFNAYQHVTDHHKYRNNYDYYKSIYLVNKTPHLDTGFLLVISTDELSSPISVLFHQEYDDITHLTSVVLADKKEKIQCIVGNNYVPFGKSQRMELWDYADHVDVMEFLIGLN